MFQHTNPPINNPVLLNQNNLSLPFAWNLVKHKACNPGNVNISDRNLRIQPKINLWVHADSRLGEYGEDGQDVEGEAGLGDLAL